MTDQVQETEIPLDVLILEDDAEMAGVYAGAVTDLGYIPHAFTTQAELLQAAGAGRFGLAILDRMVPDGDAIDLIAKLRQQGHVQAILIVSALAHAGHRVEGLDRGADDYLAKPFAPEELRARIRALMRRGKAQTGDNDILAFGDLEIRAKARNVHFGQKHVALSPTEFDLLLYLARNAGVPVGRMQLLEHVWNLHFDPQTNVVDVHVSRLRRKLEAQTGMHWVLTERGAGYYLDPMARAISGPGG